MTREIALLRARVTHATTLTEAAECASSDLADLRDKAVLCVGGRIVSCGRLNPAKNIRVQSSLLFIWLCR